MYTYKHISLLTGLSLIIQNPLWGSRCTYRSQGMMPDYTEVLVQSGPSLQQDVRLLPSTSNGDPNQLSLG